MCQVCATTSDCSRAYLDGPGQFCGNWLDRLNQRQRCCCPRDAICKVSNYTCNCKRQPQNTYRPSSSLVTSLTTVAFGGLTIGHALADAGGSGYGGGGYNGGGFDAGGGDFGGDF
uniref:Uncharacterized protein n=1 Tax=Globisporangium ultimum (strain ATCC 200006 / CBS 805.95 / DAOM BR144) TaxID=431595 RepID=K3XBC7_GLOUD